MEDHGRRPDESDACLQCSRSGIVDPCGVQHKPDIEMATLTIRKLDPAVKERLRVRAAQHGHSMEEEARRILSESCGQVSCAENLADIALRLFGDNNGIELELPARRMGREPLAFD
jgi:antitoxin FitA